MFIIGSFLGVWIFTFCGPLIIALGIICGFLMLIEHIANEIIAAWSRHNLSLRLRRLRTWIVAQSVGRL